MTEKEIRKKRNNLKSKIKTQATNIKTIVSNIKDTKDNVIEYNKLTGELQKLGYPVFIPSDFLIPSYWEVPENVLTFLDDRFCKDVKKIATNPVSTANEKPQDIPIIRTGVKIERYEEPKDITPSKKKTKGSKKEDVKTKPVKVKHVYILTLAWSETKSNNPSSKPIENIKKYFESMKIKMTSDDFSDIGNRVEHMMNYRFYGTEEAFEILKKTAQFIIDNSITSDYDKFNVDVFGKKLE